MAVIRIVPSWFIDRIARITIFYFCSHIKLELNNFAFVRARARSEKLWVFILEYMSRKSGGWWEPTSVAIQVVCPHQIPCYRHSVPPSWCRTVRVRWCNRSSAIRSAMHIYLSNCALAECPLRTSARTPPAATAWIPTFSCATKSAISVNISNTSQFEYTLCIWFDCVLCCR